MDAIVLRGQWKHQKRQVDTSVDTRGPYTNSKVCVSLCVGGTIRYNLVVGSGLDDCWELKNVVPNISKYHFCKKVVGVFGKEILWACFGLSSLQVCATRHSAQCPESI